MGKLAKGTWIQAVSPAAILIEHFDGHRKIEAPNHLDGAFGFETHELCRTEECEWGCDSIHLLPGSNKEKHCVAALHMMDIRIHQDEP